MTHSTLESFSVNVSSYQHQLLKISSLQESSFIQGSFVPFLPSIFYTLQPLRTRAEFTHSNPVAKGNRSWFLWHNNLYTFGLNFNFGTITYSDCQNLLWRYAHVWFSGWNCNPKFLKLTCIIFFNNICLLRKFHFNQGQSSIQCPSLTSRFREKWRREQGFVHVYGK